MTLQFDSRPRLLTARTNCGTEWPEIYLKSSPAVPSSCLPTRVRSLIGVQRLWSSEKPEVGHLRSLGPNRSKTPPSSSESLEGLKLVATVNSDGDQNGKCHANSENEAAGSREFLKGRLVLSPLRKKKKEKIQEIATFGSWTGLVGADDISGRNKLGVDVASKPKTMMVPGCHMVVVTLTLDPEEGVNVCQMALHYALSCNCQFASMLRHNVNAWVNRDLSLIPFLFILSVSSCLWQSRSPQNGCSMLAALVVGNWMACFCGKGLIWISPLKAASAVAVVNVSLAGSLNFSSPKARKRFEFYTHGERAKYLIIGCDDVPLFQIAIRREICKTESLLGNPDGNSEIRKLWSASSCSCMRLGMQPCQSLSLA
ncbi:hypothetical protein M9H77_07057 [Catharanthus roseus]|uniref:Uncharacterized protein n=1 Tax=Catharanthus roseus TaxID=4058 RepID=A0ACC0BU40_CATRO|nr:hypothetical protein M9H77_07057 [Catharanthus roseus]